MTFWLSMVLAVAAGCATELGRVRAIVPAADVVGVKVIRRVAGTRACSQSVLWWQVGEEGPPLARALAGIIALDEEANVITDVRIRQHRILTGLYNRDCVEVVGGLGRTIPTLVIPGHGSARGADLW
jgi:hypothetical protein